MRLSHSDFDLLQGTLVDLYEYRDLEAFRRVIHKYLFRLIPADHFSLVTYDVNPAAHSTKLVDCLESGVRVTRAVIEQWEKLVWQHPFTRYFLSGGQPTTLMFSDFFTATQLRNSPFWEAICTVLEYDCNLSVPVITSLGISAISLGRRRKHFTERDRLVLNLLRPHFNRAWRNAEIITSRKGGAARQLSDFGLLPRETEIAYWISQGKTNPEIATILQISPRTVEKHVEHILIKLGVENRASAAVIISRSTNKLGPRAEEPRNRPNTRRI